MAYNKFSKKNLLKANYEATKLVFLPAIIEETPKATGKLARDWQIRKNNKKVWIENKNSDLINWLDKGTKPYVIKPKDKKSLRWFSAGNIFFAKEVHHPGIKARRFVTKVFDNESMKAKLAEEIEKSITKMLEGEFKNFG